MGVQADGGVLESGRQGRQDEIDMVKLCNLPDYDVKQSGKTLYNILQEKELGLDISPMCDRDMATIEKSQVEIINKNK